MLIAHPYFLGLIACFCQI